MVLQMFYSSLSTEFSHLLLTVFHLMLFDATVYEL